MMKMGKIAKKFIRHYKLNNVQRFDIGCGKGFLVYELKKLLPKAKILGVDISKYALNKSKKRNKKFLSHGQLVI